MSRPTKLCLFYLLLTTWNKAGHAKGYGTIALAITGLIIIIFLFSDFKSLKKQNSLIYLPLVSLIILSIVAWFNPRYRTLTINDLSELNFEKTLIDCGDPEKVEMISTAINLTLDQSISDPLTSIALFYHFKETYIDKYVNQKYDPILNLLYKCEKKITLEYIKYLPSCAVASNKYLYNLYFFIISFVVGICLYNKINNKSQFINFIWILLCNCLVLCLVGFWQKNNHQWSDNYIEILGIWDAPEPRYYFSTFTYKNHWSAYAIMMLCSGIYLLICESKKAFYTGTNIAFSKTAIFLVLSILIISFSVFFSGSRSGVMILLIAIIYILFKLIYKYKKRFVYHIRSNLIRFCLFLPLFILLTYVFINDKKWEEMQKNTSIQWQNLQDGKSPLRVFFWKDTIEMIKEKPFWGFGYNSFSSMYPKFQSKEVRNERARGLECAHNPYVPLVAHAHSDVLEFITEWGLIGLFLIFVPFLFFLIKILFFTKNNPSGVLAIGCFCFLLYCLVDFPTRTPACLVTFCTMFALSMKSYSLKVGEHSRF